MWVPLLVAAVLWAWELTRRLRLEVRVRELTAGSGSGKQGVLVEGHKHADGVGKGPNWHVYEYLDYYTKLESPTSCVLVTGSWGAGKTWLVRDYFRSRHNECLYVSAYGAKDSDEIAQRLFVAMYPVLSSKGVAIAGRVVKGLLKGALKIDLDGDSQPDATLSPQLPGVEDAQDVAKAAQRFRGKTIVIDDLERSSAEQHDLWGLLNRLVEDERARVVVIANEDEFGDPELHRKTKEKNVGMTLRVSPCVADVLPSFMGSTSSLASASNARLVLDVVGASGCQNLRVIHNAVRDLGRVLEGLESEYAQSDDAVSLLTRTTLAFAIEVYRGSVRPRSIERVAMSRYFASEKDELEDDEDSVVRRAFSKYKAVFDLRPTPPLRWWADFFEFGVCDSTELNAALKARYDDSQPNWRRVTALSRLEDDEFEDLLEKTLSEMVRDEYEEIGPIFHVAGAHLWAVENGLSNADPDELVASTKAALDALTEDEFLVGYKWDELTSRFDASAGMYYLGHETRGLTELKRYAIKREEEVLEARRPRTASVLLGHIRAGNVDAFSAALDTQHGGLSDVDRRVLQSDTLSLIDVQAFADAVLALPAPCVMTVAGVLNRRSLSDAEHRWVHEVAEHVGDGPGLRRMVAKNRLKAALEK